MIDLGGVAPYCRRVIVAVGECPVGQTDAVAIVDDVLLDATGERDGSSGAAVDDAGNLDLQYRSGDLFSQFSDLDKVVLVLA